MYMGRNNYVYYLRKALEHSEPALGGHLLNAININLYIHIYPNYIPSCLALMCSKYCKTSNFPISNLPNITKSN